MRTTNRTNSNYERLPAKERHKPETKVEQEDREPRTKKEPREPRSHLAARNLRNPRPGVGYQPRRGRLQPMTRVIATHADERRDAGAGAPSRAARAAATPPRTLSACAMLMSKEKRRRHADKSWPIFWPVCAWLAFASSTKKASACGASEPNSETAKGTKRSMPAAFRTPSSYFWILWRSAARKAVVGSGVDTPRIGAMVVSTATVFPRIPPYPKSPTSAGRPSLPFGRETSTDGSVRIWTPTPSADFTSWQMSERPCAAHSCAA
mmetsp:Transcript_43549/g.112819  ORF Transcript_43549/g.112819 Transcript_43549/m.112819 type:complete len:265 (-) Transcript_43549:338-1132(-)